MPTFTIAIVHGVGATFCCTICTTPVIIPRINRPFFINTVTRNWLVFCRISPSALHVPIACDPVMTQCFADCIASVLPIMISATCMQRPCTVLIWTTKTHYRVVVSDVTRHFLDVVTIHSSNTPKSWSFMPYYYNVAHYIP